MRIDLTTLAKVVSRDNNAKNSKVFFTTSFIDSVADGYVKYGSVVLALAGVSLAIKNWNTNNSNNNNKNRRR